MTEKEEKKTRVLVATGIYPPDIGGPATYLSQFVPYLAGQGTNVHVVTFADVQDVSHKEEEHSGVIRVPRNAFVLTRLWQYYRALKRQAKVSDVMYVHDMSSVGVVALAVSFFTKCPYIVRIGGDFVWEQAYQKGDTTLGYRAFQGKEPFFYGMRRMVANEILRRAKAVVVPSNFLRRIVADWNIDPEKIKVVPNAVDLQYTQSVLEGSDLLQRIRTLQQEGKKVIISSGRFVKWKHFGTLIRAISHLRDTHFILVGAGPEEKKYRTLIKERELEGRAELVSSQPRAVLFEALKLADCFALVSEGDTFSFVSLEALYAGTPVVFTREGGLEEIFSPYKGRGVTFVDNRDTATLIQTLGNIDALSVPTAEVQEELKARYSIEEHFASVHAIVREIIENHERRTP